jgi:hypothetical protein
MNVKVQMPKIKMSPMEGVKMETLIKMNTKKSADWK